jgi:adenylate cyclase
MAIRVTYLEQERASAKTTKNLSAYDEYLRGRQVFRQYTLSANLRSRGFFEKAIELDPNYADALAMLAWTYSKAADLGWTERPHQALERAHDLAQAALRLNPSNELAHVLLAVNYAYRRQFDLALSELQHAAKANPNYGGNSERGWVLLLASRSGEAISVLEDALRFDPHPVPTVFFSLGLAYYLNERYSDAIAILEAGIGRYPQHRSLYVALAASYGETGRLDDAKRVAANLRSLDPFFEADQFGEAFRDPADRKRIQDGLRKAGL